MSIKNFTGVSCHCCGKLVFNIQPARFKNIVVDVCRECAWKPNSGYSFVNYPKEDFDLVEVKLKKGDEVLAVNLVNSRLFDAYAEGKISLKMLFPENTYNEET